MIIGIDAGNYETKIAGPYGVIKFKSNLGTYIERNLDNRHGEDDMVVDYNGQKWFAGTIAEVEDEYGGGTIMGDSKAHEEAKLRVLMAIHRYSNDYDNKIVVGQPIGKHSKEEKEKIKKMLLGKHTILINGHEKTFNITGVEVAAEGGSSFWSYIQPGLIRIVDVGSGTVNCASLLNKRYINKDSFTINFGANTANNQNFEGMARGIAQKTLKKWKKDDKVLIAGGIAEEIYPYLEVYFKNIQVLRPRLPIGDGIRIVHPQYANAIGFYEIARRLYA